MDEILNSRLRRNQLLITVIPTAAVILLIRWLVLPAIDHSATPTVGEVIGSVMDLVFGILVASVVIALIVRWLVPPSAESRALEVLAPDEIGARLDAASTRTQEWWYRGHTGRHFRSVTLPRLAREARAGNYSINVTLQILDPGNKEVCEYYANYRQGLRSALDDAAWTAQRVRCELFATLLLSAAYAVEEPLLKVRLAVSHTMSVYRTDLSSTTVIVTKEDPREPALACALDSFFYRSFREDARLSLEQGRELPTIRGPKRAEFDRPRVEKLLVGLGFEPPAMNELDNVIELARRAKNPYS
jgi:hypothetical protein